MATVPNIIANLATGNQPASLLDQNWAACAVLANNLSDIPSPSTALATLGGLSASAVLPWTPADASGAGLSFSNVDAAYQTIGNFVHAYFSLTYPATADGTLTLIGGLPINAVNGNRGNVACVLQNDTVSFLTFGVMVKNTKTFGIWSASAGHFTNANLSTHTFSGIIIYPTT
jgi:hypothetical protein